MGNHQHIVYMLRCKDNTIYTGYTNDLKHRLQMHEQGKGAKYTRGRGPFDLLHLETFETKGEAMSRERAIKQLSRREKLQLIQEGSGVNANSKEF
ncbi:GIY-YIG nuclease family protein [Virgibacillus sp. 179-BFC.A HS]|uniref:GIY-YIG nuclease family protein n=1 Tax=Tigheibacillus jepli TaxID=3035914 RepID=A0ABU5CDY1_9BACI|nr:GIY-YIG nuclease family protein [Virgibacillus sp. 179-BFC.A HS]MDY0404052.1 GIY-YIG nuclease family protein [Virgibacillus sp. 179-BFC.A HS]